MALPRQQGQAAVFTLVFMAALLVGIALMYNSGRLSLTKMHLQNTADSAAYSGAVLLARDYNFSSYANRAMVANQVAIAQMVGLASFAQFECRTYNDECNGEGNPFAMPTQVQDTVSFSAAGGLYGPLLSAQAFLSKALDKVALFSSPKLARLADMTEVGLSDGSRVFHDAVAAEIAAGALNKGLIGEVVKANDPQARVSLVGRVLLVDDAKNLLGFTKTYAKSGDTAGKNRFAPMVFSGLDGFSQQREANGTVLGAYPIINPDVIPDTQLFTAIWTTHHGSTEWKNGYTSWSAMDTSSIEGFNLSWCFDPFPFICPIPIFSLWDPAPVYFWPQMMASGAAGVGSSSGDPLGWGNNVGPGNGFWGSYDSSYPWNFIAAEYQDRQGIGSAMAGVPYHGLQPYQDVAATGQGDYQAPPITVILARGESTLSTTSQIGVDAGSLSLKDNAPSNQIEAMASAEAHFERPLSYRLLAGHLVYGNLFNPYWEPHLVPTDAATRAAAVAAQLAGHG